MRRMPRLGVPWAPALDGRMLLLATHDAADAQALNILGIITL